MSFLEEKPALAELAHHGVLGMKWGHRKKANAAQIRLARRHVSKQAEDFHVQYDVTKAAKGTKKYAAEKYKLDKMKVSFLKNPDRVIAARMTRGEKAVTLIGASFAFPGAGLVPGAAVVAATSARSRRIEQKQDTGAYDKKK